MDTLKQLQSDIVSCTLCPRLVAHRELTAQTKRRMYMKCSYWGKPVPSFGDPNASLFIIGLAPAAHGANRTGRMFTGDRSGVWLYRALHKFGFASSPESNHRNDNLTLLNAYISAAVRCAPPGNKPLREELLNCRQYLAEELRLINTTKVVLVLGKIALDAYLTVSPDLGITLPTPKPTFGHGKSYCLTRSLILVTSYHPSQQNTQTGRLTQSMFNDVFTIVRNKLAKP